MLVKALNERFPDKTFKVRSKDTVGHLRLTLVQWRPPTVEVVDSDVHGAANAHADADAGAGNVINNAGAVAKTWCICEMPEEDFNAEMDMVQCQGATCKQRWFHYECIGKPQDWDPTNEDYYCAYCTRRK